MSKNEVDDLKAEIDQITPDLIALRRDFHEHPELGFEELRTAGIVAQRLRTLGLEVQENVGKTGVVGLLRGGASGSGSRTLAIRADMDALPVHEQADVDYRSRVDGKMHACGHDGHTAIALTVANILSKRRNELMGNVKFLFQPAEEIINGAKLMIEEGALNGVDGVIGLHLISAFPSGSVGVRSGAVLASADEFVLTIQGKGGHAAMPHLSIDPIVIAAQIITALQTLISRETSPFQPAVITIGTLQAGTAFNIIPDSAEMRGTIRAFSAEHRAVLLRRIENVAQGIAEAMGASCNTQIIEGCPPCINDPTMSELVYNVALTAVGKEAVDSSENIMLTGSDDMSYILSAVPGCYFFVGAGHEEKGTQYPHHHPHFAIDEDALPIGVEVLTRATLTYLKKDQ